MIRLLIGVIGAAATFVLGVPGLTKYAVYFVTMPNDSDSYWSIVAATGIILSFIVMCTAMLALLVGFMLMVCSALTNHRP